MNLNQRGFVLGVVLTIVLIVALAITGAVFLVVKARQATPSSWLYPIQVVSQKIELWLTPGREARAFVLLKLADHEVNDIARLTTEKEFEDVIEESQDLRWKLEDIREQAIEIEAVGKSVGDLNASTKSIADKAVTNLTIASEQASGADRGKIMFEISLLGVFTK